MYLTFMTSQKLLTATKVLVRSCSNNGLGKISILKPLARFSSSASFEERRSFSVCKFTPLSSSALNTTPCENRRSCNRTLLQQRRFYRSGRGNRAAKETNDSPQPSKSPQLMDFPWIIWPSLLHTIRNWVFANLIIRPHMDNEFTLSSFKIGAIQALVHVSQEISKGNFLGLDGYMTKLSIEEAQSNFNVLSVKQRIELAVVAEDIFLCFPYQIGVIYTNEGGPKERVFVEVTMCYHIFRGFQDHIDSLSKSDITGPFKGVYDNYDRISIANYRFIREFTKGVEDQWTVNVANHFKPGEYIQ